MLGLIIRMSLGVLGVANISVSNWIKVFLVIIKVGVSRYRVNDCFRLILRVFRILKSPRVNVYRSDWFKVACNFWFLGFDRIGSIRWHLSWVRGFVSVKRWISKFYSLISSIAGLLFVLIVV